MTKNQFNLFIYYIMYCRTAGTLEFKPSNNLILNPSGYTETKDINLLGGVLHSIQTITTNLTISKTSGT